MQLGMEDRLVKGSAIGDIDNIDVMVGGNGKSIRFLRVPLDSA